MITGNFLLDMAILIIAAWIVSGRLNAWLLTGDIFAGKKKQCQAIEKAANEITDIVNGRDKLPKSEYPRPATATKKG